MSRKSLKVPNKFLIFKRIQLHGFWVTEWMKETDPDMVRNAYAQLAQWVTENKLTQPVDSSYSLAEIHPALTRAMEDKRNGKVLIRCSPD
jgi:NADPH:quinone reductase-like Zn-dependent oxidoreductase